LEILALSADDVAAACKMPDCIEEMARVFALQGQGKAEAPLRTVLAFPMGDVLVMPSTVKARTEASVKVISVFPKNTGGVPSINAVTVLVDGETGEPRALLSGGMLTAIRTGAVSGLSCRYLAREDSKELGMVGAGGMAYEQVNGVVSALPSIAKVRIYSYELDRSRALAKRCSKELGVDSRAVGKVEDCVRGSDVVVTATTSARPVFDGSLVEEGTHVIAMGSYRPTARELDTGLVARASVFVDSRKEVLEEAGDILIPIKEGKLSEGAIKAELSELVAGKRRGRRSRSEITVFKEVGLAFEDNAAGWLAYRNATKMRIGKLVKL
jgi:ornithine cyclodeaminase/alanine dehydrogenase-like protein (mu-crystallin family)